MLAQTVEIVTSLAAITLMMMGTATTNEISGVFFSTL